MVVEIVKLIHIIDRSNIYIHNNIDRGIYKDTYVHDNWMDRYTDICI